jgi:hypothetical protein
MGMLHPQLATNEDGTVKPPRTTHLLLLLTIHGFLDGHAASTVRKDGQSQNTNDGWNFFVAGKGAGNGQAKSLHLNFHNGASVKFTLGSTAAARKAGSACDNNNIIK